MEFSKDIWITIFLRTFHPFWQKKNYKFTLDLGNSSWENTFGVFAKANLIQDYLGKILFHKVGLNSLTDITMEIYLARSCQG